MAVTYRADDWQTYRMDYGNPHREVEPPTREIAVVAGALEVGGDLVEVDGVVDAQHAHRSLA